MNKKRLQDSIRILKQEYSLNEEEIRYIYNYKHGELMIEKLIQPIKELEKYVNR